jgi:hypothetical protein
VTFVVHRLRAGRYQRKCKHSGRNNGSDCFHRDPPTTHKGFRSVPSLRRPGAALRRAPVIRGTGHEVRIRIAPAAIRSHHIRLAFFNRAVLTVPIRIPIALRGHSTPGRFIRSDWL